MLCSQINFHHNRVVLRVVCPLFTELTQEGSTFRDPVILRLFGRQMYKHNKVGGVTYKTCHDFLVKKKNDFKIDTLEINAPRYGGKLLTKESYPYSKLWIIKTHFKNLTVPNPTSQNFLKTPLPKTTWNSLL